MEFLSEVELIVQEVVASRLFEGYDFKTYYVENKADHIYAIITSAPPAISSSLVALLARIESEKVIIEVDTSSSSEIPLYKSLMEKGISREQLVFAYLHGETPEKHHHA
jgi:hypothetical protein